MHLKNDFKLFNRHDLTYLVCDKWQQDKSLIHCFTTRHGGVSTGPLASLNLGFNRGDEKENVLGNYERVCEALQVDLRSVVLSPQVHETQVVKIEKEDRGNGIFYKSKWASADGMYTTEPHITLVTHYADCVPLLFYAPQYAIIGMTHAGWRGTVHKIAKVLIDKWVKDEHIPMSAIEVAIGPSIGSCCFEVGEQVAHEFMKEFGEQPFISKDKSTSKYHIDLWQCNKYILMQEGIEEKNIYTAGLCTSCHEDLFFSHRKSKGNRGTLGAFMSLRA